MELHKRLDGTVLKKELSYFGGLRVPQEEVLVSIADRKLMQYYGYTAWLRGTASSRLTEDPCNQVYAAWLVALAGDNRSKLWTNNRERLGDMVEGALAICWMVDDYPTELGHILDDPNGMWGRIEQSLRLSMTNRLHDHFDFGTRSL